MGQCISKNQEDESSKCTSPPALMRPHQNQTQYKSELINPLIGNVVIVEEESHLNQSSLISRYSALEDPTINKSQLIQTFQKARPLGAAVTQHTVVRLINVALAKKLHSHAVRYECGSKQHEVSLCSEFANEYDEWNLISDHERSIKDQNIVVLQHRLTRHIMRSSAAHLSKYKLQQVSCVEQMNELSEDDYWKVEILSDTKRLLLNSLIRIKHINTNGYLCGSKNKATIKEQNEVCVLPTGHEVWVIEEAK